MPEASDPVVIASFARTPMGGFQGAFTPVKAPWKPPIGVRAKEAMTTGSEASGMGAFPRLLQRNRWPWAREMASAC